MSIRQGNKIIAGNVDNTDYTALLNKPQINSVELSGNKTLEDLGIQAKGEYALKSEMELKADKADTLAGYGITDGLSTSQITNCITKIPQDIKLELSEDGTLTKKAGTKFYIPNGFEEDGTTPKFDILVLDKDYSGTGSPTSVGTKLQITNPSNLPDFPRIVVENCYSGDTPPSGASLMFWYDTANNLVKLTKDGGNNWNPGYSLPYAITTEGNQKYVSIDQVFNGFGYIGSTIFTLPGVEGLIPNGRNEDGSLTNTKFMTTKVLTFTESTVTAYSFLRLNQNLFVPATANTANRYYDEERNYNIFNDNIDNTCRAGFIQVQSGRITSFNPKTTFHTVDRNDTEWAGTAGKPSDRYVDLTLGASGSTYIAPANGTVYFAKQAGANTPVYLWIENTNSSLSNISWINSNGSSDFTSVSLTVATGDVFKVYYTANGNTNYFRFIFDKGVK